MTNDQNTRRVLAAGVALALLGFCGIWLAGRLLDREPVYRGKRLSTAWLDERRDTGKGLVVLTSEAERAIRAIGPAAIPTLLSWIEARDSMVTEWAVGGVMRIGRSFPITTNADKRRRAIYGFRAPPVWPPSRYGHGSRTSCYRAITRASGATRSTRSSNLTPRQSHSSPRG